jgi:NAD-dependent SIR2 family protein deacetylase
MSKIVFVLGAGASHHCGTPLMNNFLEVAEDLWRRGEVTEASEHFKRVFEAIGFLQGIHSKAKLDTYNVENVYAAFEMGKLLGSLPGSEEMGLMEGRDPASVRDALISSIKKVIAYTLERTTKLPHSDTGELNPSESYYEFAGIISSLITGRKGCSIITFNYDLGLDYALYKRAILPDYGLNDISPSGMVVTYLKLHGSLNWGKCTKCGKVKPYRAFQYTQTKPGLNYSVIPVISELKNLKCTCGEPLEKDPFIVPPTWNKTAFHEQIDNVWKRAAQELNDAEHIFVLGYSLPSTDLFFNYLFALGVDMRTILKGFYVYNTDSGTEERFRNLLGSGVIQRFLYQGLKFEDAIRKEISGWKDYMELGRRYLTIPQILEIH